MNRKVTVVGGAGNVGATVARSIAERELADVVIVDIADQKAAGVALDLADVVGGEQHGGALRDATREELLQIQGLDANHSAEKIVKIREIAE